MTSNTYGTITNYNFPTTSQSNIRITKKQDRTVWCAGDNICKAIGIIRSTKKVDPDMSASISMHGAQASTLDSKLEVEMR